MILHGSFLFIILIIIYSKLHNIIKAYFLNLFGPFPDQNVPFLDQNVPKIFLNSCKI